MNTVKILHCADVHIGAEQSFLGFKAESRRRETLLTFEKIVDLCQENEVQVLLISGDLFDSNNIPNSFFEAVFSKIKAFPDLNVVYVAGNHDFLGSRSPFLKSGLPKNLYVLKTEESFVSFPELNLRVYGRSFESAFLKGKSVPGLVATDDGMINISLLHGELTNDLSSDYNAITKDYIENSKMDYIALGHIHKRSDIGKIGDTYFAYPGCPEGQGFDELGQKGVLMGEIGKGICNLQFVPTSRRQHILEKIDLTDVPLISADYILNYLEQKYGDSYIENLYKIELSGSISPETVIDCEDITARLNEKVYFAKIKNDTTIKFDLDAIAKEQSLKGIFVKNMLEKIRNADENDKHKYEYALNLGLKAFSGEVKFNEN